jgi:hypothetical protein
MMNRDDDTTGPTDPGGPPQDDTTLEPADNETKPLPNNVIAFPGTPRPTPVEAPAEPDFPTIDEVMPLEEESGMTLDAFERAVRNAVADKLGDDVPGSPPRGADELVAQVFSALTGKDAKSALSEVRARLAEPSAFIDTRGDASVIDLSAVREARQKQSLEAASKLGGALKDTFAQFLGNLAQRPGQSGEITLDANFFKQHGPSLLGNIFQSLASAFMQQARQGVQPDAGTHAEPAAAHTHTHTEAATPSETTAPASSADAPSATPPPANAPVQVKLDLGSLLSGLFRRMVSKPPDPNGPAGPTPPTTTTTPTQTTTPPPADDPS